MPPPIRTYSRRTKPSSFEEQELANLSSLMLLESIHEQKNIRVDSEVDKKRTGRITDFFPRSIQIDDHKFDRSTRFVNFQESPECISTIDSQKKMRQTFLDLGQICQGVRPCKDCGFLYDPSLVADAKLHQKEHNRINEQRKISHVLNFASWKRQFSNGHRILECPLLKLPPVTLSFVQYVNDEIISAIKLDSSRDYNVLFYAIEGGEIVSLLVINFELSRVLIERVWTRQEHRRRGYATKLLKSIRFCRSLHSDFSQCSSHCFFKSHNLSFSQPTALGKHLADSIECNNFHT